MGLVTSNHFSIVRTSVYALYDGGEEAPEATHLREPTAVKDSLVVCDHLIALGMGGCYVLTAPARAATSDAAAVLYYLDVV